MLMKLTWRLKDIINLWIKEEAGGADDEPGYSEVSAEAICGPVD
jgi:hypothetical protein